MGGVGGGGGGQSYSVSLLQISPRESRFFSFRVDLIRRDFVCCRANRNKKSQRLPLEIKYTLQIENGSLGFIKTLHKSQNLSALAEIAENLQEYRYPCNRKTLKSSPFKKEFKCQGSEFFSARLVSLCKGRQHFKLLSL